jgi:ribosome-associated translation inhibitor RaiA
MDLKTIIDALSLAVAVIELVRKLYQSWRKRKKKVEKKHTAHNSTKS